MPRAGRRGWQRAWNVRFLLDRGSANCAAALTLPLPLLKNNLFGGSGSAIHKMVLNSRLPIRAKKRDTSEIQVSRNHQTHCAGHRCREKSDVTLFCRSQDSGSQEIEAGCVAGPHAHPSARREAPGFFQGCTRWGRLSYMLSSDAELVASQGKHWIPFCCPFVITCTDSRDKGSQDGEEPAACKG